MRPWFASERWGSAPYRTCRVSADFHATMVATDNEANLNDFARPRGKRGREKVLRRGWKAFLDQTPADANGWADQGDVIRIHRAMFPGLPDPKLGSSKDPSRVLDLIGPNAVSLAIDTSVLPPTDAVRRYVGAVAHQGVAYEVRTRDGRREVKWIDAMHPPSDTYTGHWVLWSSLVRGARAIGGSNTFYFELYPAGQWTDAALEEANWQSVVMRKNDRITRLKADLEAEQKETAALMEQLDECRSDCGDGATEALLDDLEEWIEERRG